MNRKLFTSIIIKEEGIRLDYYLLTDPAVDAEGNPCPTYGVEICQTPLDTFSCVAYLHCAVPDISSSCEKVTDFLRQLSDSRTDPSCLEDIVEEIISEPV